MIKRLLSTAVLVFASTATNAQHKALKTDMVAVGHSAEQVLALAGKPDRIVRMPGASGQPAAERHEYFSGDRTVVIVIRNGSVISISEHRSTLR